MIEVRLTPGGTYEIVVPVPLAKVQFSADAFAALLRDRRPSAQLADHVQWFRAHADAGADVARRITDANARRIAAQTDSPEYAAYDVLDTAEAAAIVGISPGGVRDLARRGRLAAHRAGGRWLYPAASVVAYAELRASRR